MKLFRSSALLALLLGVLAVSAFSQITINGSGSYSTIQSAVNAASDGDVIAVPNNTYAESVTITKTLTINGQSEAGTIVDPVTGSGFQINAAGKNVTITNLTVTGAPDEGINAASCQNLTLTNVTSSNNGTGNNGSGFNVVNATGTTTLTSLTASGNARHGLSIRSSGVTVSGGSFTSNGVAGDIQSGAGILVIKESGSLSNVTINGVTSSTNKVAGIMLYAIGGTIANVQIGQSTTVTLEDNGSNVASSYGTGGAAVLIYGAVDGTTITADATDNGTLTNAAGLVVVGSDEFGANSPTNTTVLNSSITGYTGGSKPAGTMYLSGDGTTLICNENVDATVGNLINGVATGFNVEDALYHKLDDATLGLFRGPGTVLYVTPNSGSVQRAIDIANNPYSVTQINVADGNYQENVNVNEAVVLNGQGSGTKLDAVNFTVDVTVAGVTLQNLNIYVGTAAGFGVSTTPTATNMTFTHRINLKVFLQGPYSGGTMTTALNTNGVIPLSQPYSGAPWSYAGSQSVASIPANVTDWVLVELRTGTAASTTIGASAGFLKNDGSIVDPDGTSQLPIEISVPTGIVSPNCYAVVRHRNHLAIMSAAAEAFGSSPGLSGYDFTTAQTQAFGASPMKDLTGAFGMIGGDVDGNGAVRYNSNPSDRSAVLSVVSTLLAAFPSSGFTYSKEDVNMDGKVRYNSNPSDRSLVLSNVTTLLAATTTKVPN